jgi:hypothetical protein
VQFCFFKVENPKDLARLLVSVEDDTIEGKSSIDDDGNIEIVFPIGLDIKNSESVNPL